MISLPTESSFSGDDFTSIPITITDSGTITDLNVKVTLDHNLNSGLEWVSVSLFSPYGNSILLGAGNYAGGNWSGRLVGVNPCLLRNWEN